MPVTELTHKCLNKFCINYQIPVSIEKENPLKEKYPDATNSECWNCNLPLKKIVRRTES